MLEDRLYVRSSDRRVFIVKSGRREPDRRSTLIDPLTLQDAGLERAPDD